ncbi:MAG: cytochrome c biogenesis protein CcdA [Clostridia bacterium]|nr:cytochrome c biogenesis protein CcdA [Clostridia bacterium]
MDYLLTFLEGIISFISPCMLPMLPIYVSYFAGGDGKRAKTFSRALAFVFGFTVVFCLLGLAFGSIGAAVGRSGILNIICGLIVIIFGLSYLDIIKLPFLKGSTKTVSVTGIASAFLFGMVFSVSLTPCVGVFLGSALALASSSGTVLRGVLLLLMYSLGIGIPFLVSAMLIDKLKGTFNIIKRHYTIINRVCGIFLIIVGISMIFGLLQRLLSVFSV